MGKYQIYGERLDTLARQRFSDYEKAAAAFEKAKKEKAANPYREGWGVTPEMQLKAKKAEVNYLEAKTAFEEAERVYNGTLAEVAAIREELLNEICDSVAVVPEEMNWETVELLKSGICSADEIAELYDKADNVTTKRYIAKFASDEIDRVHATPMESQKKFHINSVLNKVVQNGKQYTDPEHSEPIQTFDALCNVLTRCINNPAMSKHWGALTQGALSEL